MHLISSLLILLVTSRVFGRLFVSVGQLAIVGEIIAGLVIGPVILNVVHPSPQLSGVVELGIFLLIFFAGLEMELHEALDALKGKAALSALCGFFLPIGAGVFCGQAFGLDMLESFIIGLCLAITALPVVIRMVQSFQLMDEKIGHTIVGAAIIIDIAALLILGILFDAPKDDIGDGGLINKFQSIGFTALKIILFFVGILLVNNVLRKGFLNVKRTKSFFRKISQSLGEEGIFGFSISFVLIFSFVSENLGLHFIIGAFFGGLLLNRDIMGTNFFNDLSKTVGTITNAFFAPIFFASIGMQLSLTAFDRPLLLVSVVILGYLAKFFGTWLGARLGGMPQRQGVQMGILLNCRGVTDLVIANLALEAGYISVGTFSILVIIGVVSTVLTPFFYKKFVPVKKEGPTPQPSV